MKSAPQEEELIEEEDLSLGKVLDFMRLVWALDHRLESASKRMETALGVTGPQRLVIRIIGRFPGISAGRVADILHVHPSTLTGILRRLEERGTLVRKWDPADGRRALLTLTPKGKSLDQKRTGTVEAAMQKALTKLSSKQLADTEKVLSMLIDELEKMQ